MFKKHRKIKIQGMYFDFVKVGSIQNYFNPEIFEHARNFLHMLHE